MSANGRSPLRNISQVNSIPSDISNEADMVSVSNFETERNYLVNDQHVPFREGGKLVNV